MFPIESTEIKEKKIVLNVFKCNLKDTEHVQSVRMNGVYVHTNIQKHLNYGNTNKTRMKRQATNTGQFKDWHMPIHVYFYDVIGCFQFRIYDTFTHHWNITYTPNTSAIWWIALYEWVYEFGVPAKHVTGLCASR